MNNSALTLPTDRLIDYLCVAGPGEALTPSPDGFVEILPSGMPNPISSEFEACILDRYPSTDYGDTPFPGGVAQFCFPFGIRLRRPKPPDQPLPVFFSFVATGAKGEHMYGHTLTFWEPLTEDQLAGIDPMLPEPRLATPSQSSEYVDAFVSSSTGSPEQRTAEGTGPSNDDAVASATGLSDAGVSGNDIIGDACETLTHYTSSSSSSNGEERTAGAAARGDTAALTVAAPFFAPKCITLLSRWSFPGFRTLLTEMYRLTLSPQPLPLERLIVNICKEIPLPPAGRVQVEYPIGTTTIMFRRPPPNRRVSALGLPFREVFECLDLNNILLLYRCVLCERQVLLISSQLTLLTATAEVIVSLIFPFRWTHAYIPILPRGLLEVVHAPTPFILGMHAEHWNSSMSELVPSGVIQVHLDTNEILVTPPVPSSPRSETASTTTKQHRGGRLVQHASLRHAASSSPPRGQTLDSEGSSYQQQRQQQQQRALETANATAAAAISSSARSVRARDIEVTVPRLSEHLRSKLLQSLRRHGDVYQHRGVDWSTNRLPNYDSAFDFAMRPADMDDNTAAAAAAAAYGGYGGRDDDDGGGDGFGSDGDDEMGEPGAYNSSAAGGGGGGGGVSTSDGAKGLHHTSPLSTSTSNGGTRGVGLSVLGHLHSVNSRLHGSGTGSAGKLGGYFGAGSQRSGVRVNWHSVRRAFFRVQVALLSKYREFLIYPSSATDSSTSRGPRFDKDGFLREQAPEARPLVATILTTQAWANFVDDRIQPESSSDVEIEFLDQSIDAKQNRSRFTFHKVDTPFLTSNEWATTKTVVAPSPSTAGLPPDVPLYTYSPLPRLDSSLFYTARIVPRYGDSSALVASAGGGGGIGGPGSMEIARLRRSGARSSALVAGGRLLMRLGLSSSSSPSGAGASGGGNFNLGWASSPARGVPVSAVAPSSSSSASVSGTGASIIMDELIYTTWFLAFAAAIDVMAAETERSVGKEFDEQEAEQLAAAQAAARSAIAHAAAAAAAAAVPRFATNFNLDGDASSPSHSASGNFNLGGGDANNTLVFSYQPLARAAPSSPASPFDTRSNFNLLFGRDRDKTRSKPRIGSVAAALHHHRDAGSPSSPSAATAGDGGVSPNSPSPVSSSVTSSVMSSSGGLRSPGIKVTLHLPAGNGSSNFNFHSETSVGDATAASAAAVAGAIDAYATRATRHPAPAASAAISNASQLQLTLSSEPHRDTSSQLQLVPLRAPAALMSPPGVQITSPPPLHRGGLLTPPASDSLRRATSGGATQRASRARRDGMVATAKGVLLSLLLEEAFSVLSRMRSEGVIPSEVVYRSVLEMCGRCGAFGKAHTVLNDMVNAGIAQDATLYRTLFAAFFHGNPAATSAAAGQRGGVPLGALSFATRKGPSGGGSGAPPTSASSAHHHHAHYGSSSGSVQAQTTQQQAAVSGAASAASAQKRAAAAAAPSSTAKSSESAATSGSGGGGLLGLFTTKTRRESGANPSPSTPTGSSSSGGGVGNGGDEFHHVLSAPAASLLAAAAASSSPSSLAAGTASLSAQRNQSSAATAAAGATASATPTVASRLPSSVSSSESSSAAHPPESGRLSSSSADPHPAVPRTEGGSRASYDRIVQPAGGGAIAPLPPHRQQRFQVEVAGESVERNPLNKNVAAAVSGADAGTAPSSSDTAASANAAIAAAAASSLSSPVPFPSPLSSGQLLPGRSQVEDVPRPLPVPSTRPTVRSQVEGVNPSHVEVLVPSAAGKQQPQQQQRRGSPEPSSSVGQARDTSVSALLSSSVSAAIGRWWRAPPSSTAISGSVAAATAAMPQQQSAAASAASFRPAKQTGVAATAGTPTAVTASAATARARPLNNTPVTGSSSTTPTSSAGGGAVTGTSGVSEHYFDASAALSAPRYGRRSSTTGSAETDTSAGSPRGTALIEGSNYRGGEQTATREPGDSGPGGTSPAATTLKLKLEQPGPRVRYNFNLETDPVVGTRVSRVPSSSDDDGDDDEEDADKVGDVGVFSTHSKSRGNSVARIRLSQFLGSSSAAASGAAGATAVHARMHSSGSVVTSSDGRRTFSDTEGDGESAFTVSGPPSSSSVLQHASGFRAASSEDTVQPQVEGVSLLQAFQVEVSPGAPAADAASLLLGDSIFTTAPAPVDSVCHGDSATAVPGSDSIDDIEPANFNFSVGIDSAAAPAVLDFQLLEGAHRESSSDKTSTWGTSGPTSTCGPSISRRASASSVHHSNGRGGASTPCGTDIDIDDTEMSLLASETSGGSNLHLDSLLGSTGIATRSTATRGGAVAGSRSVVPPPSIPGSDVSAHSMGSQTPAVPPSILSSTTGESEPSNTVLPSIITTASGAISVSSSSSGGAPSDSSVASSGGVASSSSDGGATTASVVSSGGASFAPVSAALTEVEVGGASSAPVAPPRVDSDAASSAVVSDAVTSTVTTDRNAAADIDAGGAAVEGAAVGSPFPLHIHGTKASAPISPPQQGAPAAAYPTPPPPHIGTEAARVIFPTPPPHTSASSEAARGGKGGSAVISRPSASSNETRSSISGGNSNSISGSSSGGSNSGISAGSSSNSLPPIGYITIIASTLDRVRPGILKMSSSSTIGLSDASGSTGEARRGSINTSTSFGRGGGGGGGSVASRESPLPPMAPTAPIRESSFTQQRLQRGAAMSSPRGGAAADAPVGDIINDSSSGANLAPASTASPSAGSGYSSGGPAASGGSVHMLEVRWGSGRGQSTASPSGGGGTSTSTMTSPSPRGGGASGTSTSTTTGAIGTTAVSSDAYSAAARSGSSGVDATSQTSTSSSNDGVSATQPNAGSAVLDTPGAVEMPSNAFVTPSNAVETPSSAAEAPSSAVVTPTGHPTEPAQSKTPSSTVETPTGHPTEPAQTEPQSEHALAGTGDAAVATALADAGDAVVTTRSSDATISSLPAQTHSEAAPATSLLTSLEPVATAVPAAGAASALSTTSTLAPIRTDENYFGMSSPSPLSGPLSSSLSSSSSSNLAVPFTSSSGQATTPRGGTMVPLLQSAPALSTGSLQTALGALRGGQATTASIPLLQIAPPGALSGQTMPVSIRRASATRSIERENSSGGIAISTRPVTPTPTLLRTHFRIHESRPWASLPMLSAVAHAVPPLGLAFADLTIDTQRESCPSCGAPLSDSQIRAGWGQSAQDYTTCCPYCPSAPGIPATQGGHHVASSSSMAGGGLPSGAGDTPASRAARAKKPPAHHRFVARFVVSSSSPSWVGTTGAAGSPLYCEYLPPAVLLKELQSAVLAGKLHRGLRRTSPVLFWNLLLWFLSYALPCDFLSYLAAADSDEAEEGAAV